MMQDEQDDQTLVAAVLASRPAEAVPADFLARVNSRIDALRGPHGWFAIADFRSWTLRLIPAAAVLAIVAVLWPAAASTGASSSTTVPAATVQMTPSQSFTPASVSDWQEDVTANALLEAALHRAGGSGAR